MLSNMIDIVPNEGYVLVRLTGEYSAIEVPDKQYSTKTCGVVIAPETDKLFNKTVYFEAYKDDIKPSEETALIKKEYIAAWANSHDS